MASTYGERDGFPSDAQRRRLWFQTESKMKATWAEWDRFAFSGGYSVSETDRMPI